MPESTITPALHRILGMLIRERSWKVVLVALGMASLVLASSSFFVVPVSQVPGNPNLRALATLSPHAPIRIIGNKAFTKANGVVSGTGTLANPYLIEDWNISYSYSVGIWVGNATSYFVIRDVEVCCGAGASGIVLMNVTHGAVKASNVTSTNIDGIDLDEDTNVSVTGGNVSGPSAAVETSLSTGVNISQVVVSSSAGWGITAWDVRGLNISKVVPRAPLAYGIHVLTSSDVRIKDTNASAAREGIDLSTITSALLVNDSVYLPSSPTPALLSLRVLDSSWVNVTGCRFGTASTIPGSGAAVHVEASNVTLTKNTVTAYGSNGIEIYAGAADVSLVDNSVQSGVGYAIVASATHRVAMIGNTLTGNASGILLNGAQGVDLEGNALASRGLVIQAALPKSFYDTYTIARNNTVGGKPIVYLRDCSGSSIDGIAVGEILAANCVGLRIANLSVSGVDYGVQVFYNQGLTIYRVNVSNCGYNGLRLLFDNDTLVTDSLFEANGFASIPVDGNWVSTWGLQASYSTRGTINRNTFLRNEGGLDLNVSYQFLIYHNNFTNNSMQAWENSGPNAWNASYPVGGNNWSDYRGWDDCHGPLQDNCTSGDGIGDFLFQVSTIGVDYYPLLAVNPPRIPPVALAQVGPALSVPAGTPVTFSATGSYDPSGLPLRAIWWDFGDGSTSNLSVTNHTYDKAGSYPVRLTVTSVRHATNTTMVSLTILPPPVLALVTYVSPRGYAVPVPRDWLRTYNVTRGNYTFELFLEGSVDGTPANMLVDTQADSTIQETDAYLNQAVQGLLQGLRSTYPDAYIVGSVYISRLAGHLAATFEVGYTAHPIFQLVLLVVSQAHGREWSIVLTGETSAHTTLNATFAEIVSGFTITAAPLPTGIFEAAQIFGAALVVVVPVILILVYLIRRGRSRPRPPPSSNCGRCNAPLRSGVSFCEACGFPVAGFPPPPRGPGSL